MPLVRRDTAAVPASETDDRDHLALLAGGSVDERWSAARSAATLPGGVEALGAALRIETDARVRTAIFTSLAHVASPACVDAVLPWLRVDDADLRTGALDALRAMPGAVLPRLPGLLEDADTDVRILSCEIARCLAPAEATRLLCDLLDREADANVCAAAVDVLAEIGQVGAEPALRRCAERFPDETFIGFAVKVALRRVGIQADDAGG
ncbi:MAG TPA: HEAT repeat domain-containing protein [Rhodopila sp.]|nr:HEAT repeat domain-containing protein [Rhodopila sp.]